MKENSEKDIVKAENSPSRFVSSEKATRFTPNPDVGLSSSQVKKRVEDGFINAPVDKSTRTVSKIILTNIFTYFNIIFFVIAAFLLAVQSYKNLTFLVVVFINTIIGIVQEIRSKKTLEKLTLISAPTTKVIRDGKTESINISDLVLDDIVILEAGNQIPADAIVCDGEINVNEALVTGESDEIKKVKGDTLLSGSFIVSGQCRARLDKVGHESFASKLMIDAKKIKKKQQPGMMKSLTLLIKIIGILIIPLAVIMYITQSGDISVKENIEKTSASVIGMIPEGLYLLTSVALALGVMRLAKKRTLVHDMKCIETLARVDVICVDKTGTITEPEMTVGDIVPLDSEYYYSAKEAVRDFVLNMSPDNITMTALRNHFEGNKSYRRAIKIKGFSSATKYSAASFGNEHYLLGAPEFILKHDYEDFKDIIEEHSMLGERVLLFAEYKYSSNRDNIFDGGFLGGIVIPIALVTLTNRVRPDAKETFNYFAEQGVTIKVISGDNPLTVSKAAEEAGIPGSEKYIDATELDSKAKIAKAILEYNIFGRVKPEQKREFIRALKKAKHTVAMTGDGVNDVLALKDADCSIAMASGSDAAANVSDLVLLDSNFSSMPAVVAEGRRVINNIQRSASLFLVKNISTFILTLFTILLSTSFPFDPVQIALLSFAMIGAPAFFLALEPNSEIVKGSFIKNVMARAVPGALVAVILVGWSMLFKVAYNIDGQIASTLCFFLYSAVAYMVLFKVCHPMNLIHKIIFGSMGLIYIIAVTVFPKMFSISPLDLGAILILVALMMLAFPIFHYIHEFFEKFGKWKRGVEDYVMKDIEKHKNKKET